MFILNMFILNMFILNMFILNMFVLNIYKKIDYCNKNKKNIRTKVKR